MKTRRTLTARFWLTPLIVCIGMLWLLPDTRAESRPNLKRLDSDHDWISDWDEIYVFHTNPHRRNTNRKGRIDGFEYDRKRKIFRKDYREWFDRDTDNDGLTDEEEAFWGTRRLARDSDEDGTVDGNEDADLDGIANEDEDDRPGDLSTREDLDDQGGQLPTPTPVPSATATKTPKPTPTPCFNELGETQCFGIPSGYTGSISAGSPVWQSTCSECHGTAGRPPRNFPQISVALSTVSEMLGISITTQQQADVVAFTNRP